MNEIGTEELNLELDELTLIWIYSGLDYHHTYPNGDETSCIDIDFDEKHLPERLCKNHQQAIYDYFQRKKVHEI